MVIQPNKRFCQTVDFSMFTLAWKRRSAEEDLQKMSCQPQSLVDLSRPDAPQTIDDEDDREGNPVEK